MTPGAVLRLGHTLCYSCCQCREYFSNVSHERGQTWLGSLSGTGGYGTAHTCTRIHADCMLTSGWLTPVTLGPCNPVTLGRNLGLAGLGLAYQALDKEALHTHSHVRTHAHTRTQVHAGDCPAAGINLGAAVSQSKVHSGTLPRVTLMMSLVPRRLKQTAMLTQH